LHLPAAISTLPSPNPYLLALGSGAQFVYISRRSFCLSLFGLLFQQEHVGSVQARDVFVTKSIRKGGFL
jgi:hypothetical protein